MLFENKGVQFLEKQDSKDWTGELRFFKIEGSGIWFLYVGSCIFGWTIIFEKHEMGKLKQVNNYWLGRIEKSDLWLLIYHLLFAIVFTLYLRANGGDAIRYWNLTAETGHDPQTWEDHWGTRSYFIQWLNYIPAKVLGLPFWLGNVLYSLASFWAIRELFQMVKGVYPSREKGFLTVLLWLIFLTPNLHFWTSGIGKESLSLVGVVMFLNGTLNLKKKWYWAILGIFLSYMVRPLQGGILLGFLFPLLWLEKSVPIWIKWIGSALMMVAGLAVLRFLLYITHMESLSPADLYGFSEEQMRFLDGFAAGSAVPMSEYSWVMKLWTLYFRPFIGEGSNFWQWMAGLENLFALLMLFVFVLGIRKGSLTKLPKFLWIGILFGFVLSIAYALTLNNLGIIMRMKSFYMPFFYLLGWGVWVNRKDSLDVN